jgi:hypothetical protein
VSYEYLTDAQVAEITHRSPRTIKDLLTAGTIRSAKIAGRRVVRRDWLDDYIESIAEGGHRRLRPVRRRAS